MQTVVTNGHKGRNCTYGVSYVTDLQSAPFAAWVPSDIKREVVELFHNMVRIVDRRVMLMVFDRDTFVIHMLYFPHKFVGSLRKDQTHLATTCFGTLIHHPTAHIGTVGITYWDSNPYLPVLETGVLPIKLRLHIMAGRVRLELTISRLTADCFTN